MALEIIGGAGAVSQLLSQAIIIIQKIHEARVQVHGTADRIDEHQSQLDNLLKTLRLVQGERELQTPAIKEQVQSIIDIGEVLQGKLDTSTTQLQRSKAKKYIHAITNGGRDEKNLNDIWARLDRAKIDLTARILAANVGLSSTVRDGFIVTLAVIQRVDRNVQKVLGERLAIAAQFEGRSSDQGGSDTVPVLEEDVRALHLDKVEWVDNKAFDEAQVFNTDLVARKPEIPMERVYRRNEAHGRSVVVQGNADAEGIVAIIRARRG